MVRMASSEGLGALRFASGASVPGTSYVLVQRLEGPGETWVVRHDRGAEQYVMKLLPGGHPDRAALAVRMQRVETRMQGGLRHKNLVAVVDVGVTSEGQP